MKNYWIDGKAYPVLGACDSKVAGTVPLVDLDLMTDERWQELARENAVRNYMTAFGHEPESADIAVAWQRARINKEVTA